MSDVKVSVLVPIYKVPERFLRQCIESLVGQTLKEIEIILVDDGSPDQCSAICDEYAAMDSRIKVIHKENGGLAAARNSAQDIATGECIMFVDGDDYLESNCCELAYNALVEHNVQLVFFNIMTEYANSSVPYKTFEEDMIFDEAQCKDLQVRVLDFNGKLAQVFAKLMRRDYLTKHNVRHIDELKQGAEGFIFNIALFEHLKSAYFLAQPLYHYVFNEQSITHTPSEENYYLIVRCFEYIEKYIQSSQNREVLERQLLNRMLYVICTTAISGYFSPANNSPFSDKIKGMERFMNEPLVKRSMLDNYARGGGKFTTPNNIVPPQAQAVESNKSVGQVADKAAQEQITSSKKGERKQYTYSVTIPHYNSSKLLKRMLDSIPEREDIQVIVVDDGSTDSEKEELKKLQHKNIEVIFTPENHGAGYERNVGLGHAKGKWLLAVDADDMFAENAFDILDKYVDSDHDYVCYCTKILDENMNPSGYKPRSNESVKAYLANKNKETLKRFKYYNPDTWNKMVSLDFIHRNNIHWENCRVNTDVLYTYQIALNAKKSIVIPDELYFLIFSSNSVTRKKRSIEREFLFYLQAQKRNGFFKRLGYGYPYYRCDFLYWPFMIRKRGIADAIKFFKYRHQHWDEVLGARKAYLPYLEGKDLEHLLDSYS